MLNNPDRVVMNNKPLILVVEDEEDLRDIIIYNLERDGYQTIGVETGEQGLERAIALKPDLVILDLMLPGMSGLNVCRKIRQGDATGKIPIIMVSAMGEEADIVNGLELGADDYVPKPFSPRILLARVRSVLRRAVQQEDDDCKIKIAELTIDSRKFQLNIGGVAIDLTKSEFSILHFLAAHPGWVFTRYQIVNAIRGEQHVVTERAVDVQIAGLRKKLGDYADLVETVRGVGYRFKE